MPASLCGRSVCRRLCARSCHCELGQARAAWLLQLQRQRRLQRQEDRHARWSVVGQAIEANVVKLAGPFQAFQLRLISESQRRRHEQLETIPSV